MTFRILTALFAACLVPSALASPADEPAVPSQPTQFQVSEQTAVPNVTLKPGSYSIRILDHLRDRVIIQVQERHSSKVETTFIAVPAGTMSNTAVGPISYGSGPKGKAAMKGFSFPGGVAVEFVYPKDDAVSIAKANDTRVMAIDPGSEGRVEAAKLKQDDMQMITLWMLEPSRVGPNDAKPGIAASKYQAPQSTGTQVAQSQPAAEPSSASATSAAGDNTSTSSAPSDRVSAPRHRRATTELAQNDVPPSPARTHTRPAVKALPHTAGYSPLLMLAGLLSFGVGGTLGVRRLTTNG